MHSEPGHIVAIEPDAARVGSEFAGDLSNQCGLARAIGSDERVHFAGLYRQVERVGGEQSAESLYQPADLEYRRAHDASRPPGSIP